MSGTPSAPNPSTGTSYPPNPLSPGARFCPLAADPATDVPDSPPAAYNSWMDPFCTDVAPPGEGQGRAKKSGQYWYYGHVRRHEQVQVGTKWS